MKPRTPSLVLAAAVLLAASAASAAVPSMQSSGMQTRTLTQSGNDNQRVTFFNKRGNAQNAPTPYAQIWGDAALGG
jgi:hypothetical protein